jgi:hypothetical protein
VSPAVKNAAGTALSESDDPIQSWSEDSRGRFRQLEEDSREGASRVNRNIDLVHRMALRSLSEGLLRYKCAPPKC